MNLVRIKSFDDQKLGTSSLGRKVTVFQQTGYLENFVQSIFEPVTDSTGGVLVLVDDGRFYIDKAIQIILSMAAANGVTKIIVGQTQDGLTLNGSAITLSASHNPGGSIGDFDIKYNGQNDGPSVEFVNEKTFARSFEIT